MELQIEVLQLDVLRDLFRTLPNIRDGAFLQDSQKKLYHRFRYVLNKPLVSLRLITSQQFPLIS